MAKPIFTVGIPKSSSEQWLAAKVKLGKSFEDYYVLIYEHSEGDVKFECFFEKDFNDVKYEELKNIINEAIA